MHLTAIESLKNAVDLGKSTFTEIIREIQQRLIVFLVIQSRVKLRIEPLLTQNRLGKNVGEKICV